MALRRARYLMWLFYVKAQRTKYLWGCTRGLCACVLHDFTIKTRLNLCKHRRTVAIVVHVRVQVHSYAVRYVTLRYIMYYDFIIAFSVDALSIRTLPTTPANIYSAWQRRKSKLSALVPCNVLTHSFFFSLSLYSYSAVNSSRSSLCYLILTPTNALQRIAFAFGRSRWIGPLQDFHLELSRLVWFGLVASFLYMCRIIWFFSSLPLSAIQLFDYNNIL